MAKPRDLGESPSRVLAAEFRTATRPTLISICGLAFAAWVVSFFLFTFGTDLGHSRVESNGILSLFISWLAISAIVCVGYGLGYLVLRSLSRGQRAYQEREVVRLALAESLATASGGLTIGFVPMTLMPNMFMMLFWTFALGFLFAFAILMPRYTASWRKAVADGRAYRG